MPAEKWVFDPSYSSVWFRISHLGVSQVRGTFRSWRGHVCIGEGGLGDSTVEVEIDPASVDTGEADLDALAIGPGFFDAENHPTISFVSDETLVVDSHHLKLVGLLTMHGVTRPVPVEVSWRGEVTDPDGVSRLGFEVEAQVNRKQFGLMWGPANETLDGMFVGETVELNFEIEAVSDSATPDAC